MLENVGTDILFLGWCVLLCIVAGVWAVVCSPDHDAIREACAPVCIVDGVQYDVMRGRSTEEVCVCDMQRFVVSP